MSSINTREKNDRKGFDEIKMFWKDFCSLCFLHHRYVLLHHVMGELEGRKGSWGYVEGGMGMVSNAIAKAATEAGAEIYTEKVRGANLLPLMLRQRKKFYKRPLRPFFDDV